MISIIRSIYESIPERPTGPLASPPGAYGETYFVTQSMLWHRGHKWLVHASRTLDLSWESWKTENQRDISREIRANIEYIESSLPLLMRYHSIQESNMGIILNINDEKTKITLIPRSVANLMRPILDSSLAYGVNISFPENRDFLVREYEIDTAQLQAPNSKLQTPHITHTEYHAGVVRPGTVILTTSQKHARDIGQELRKIHGKNTEILIQ